MPLYIAKRRILRTPPTSSGPPTYFSLAGITDPTEIAAVNTLQATLQGGTNIWGRLDRIYPVSPTSLNAASYCMKSLTQFTWFNSPTHGSTGVALDGISQYATGAENIDTLTNYTAGSGSFGIYLTAIGSYTGTKYVCGFSGIDNGDNGTSSYLRRNATTNTIGCDINGGTIASETAAIIPSFNFISRIAPNDLKRYRNGVQVATATALIFTGVAMNVKMAIGGLNASGTTGNFFPSTFAFFVIGAGLDATDQLTLYNAIQAYQTSLGRNV